MGSRVDEGRKILQAIKSLNEKKNRLEHDAFSNVNFRGQSEVNISSASEYAIYSEIKHAAIDIIENHIQKLETKFEEL